MPLLREVIDVLDELYPPRWAEEWDAVGTVAGDPRANVDSILFAVDPVQAVVDEAIDLGADLVVTHHPLLLKPIHSVAATSPKGRLLHRLISNQIALHTCHTNADSPALGVSESMGLAFGLTDLSPLEADEYPGPDKWTVFVPHTEAEKVANAMHGAGAGQLGDYDHAQFQSSGTGSFRPLEGAHPTIGSAGVVERVPETRIEMVASSSKREAVRAALIDAHPYEEVAYDVIGTAPRPSTRGSGRIGNLPSPLTLKEFAELVRDALPAHHGATRIAGDLARTISRVALCGGSGDFLLGQASSQLADVYVTSDLRHHPVSEHLENLDACAVIDVPHWAAESTWLPVAAREVSARLGGTVKTHVSTIVTDPWSATLS